jgi:hypothetical protein
MDSRKFSQHDPLAWILVAAAATLAVLLPLVPEPYRLFNFAAFGALGLFAAARIGLVPALILGLGAKLVSDWLNYLIAHPGDADYLPIWHVVLSFAVYPLFGLLAKSTRNPASLLGIAFLASVAFFVVTNFGSWLDQSLPYGYTLMGLLNAFEMGLPFYRGTLIGDVLIAGGLFALHALIQRATVVQPVKEC